jgi:transposase
MKIHTIALTLKEKKILNAIITKGSHPVRVFQRAQILLKADRGLKDKEIAVHLECTAHHVGRIRKRYCTVGLERALYDALRSGKPRTFKKEDETRIVAIACTKAPEGRSHWTGKLLAEEAVKRGVVPKISKQKIWLIMAQHDLKPWREKNVVHSKTHR